MRHSPSTIWKFIRPERLFCRRTTRYSAGDGELGSLRSTRYGAGNDGLGFLR